MDPKNNQRSLHARIRRSSADPEKHRHSSDTANPGDTPAIPPIRQRRKTDRRWWIIVFILLALFLLTFLFLALLTMVSH